MIKKIKKKYMLFLVLVLLITFIPLTYSKYIEKFTKHIVISAVQPTYEIVYNANGGTGTMGNQTFTYGISQTLTANTFTKYSYRFSGWNTESDGSGASYIDEEVVNNLTGVDEAVINLYAQWAKMDEIIVSFNSSGGTTPSFKSKTLFIGDSYGELPTTTKEGYTFLGWSKVPAEYQEVEYIESTGTQYIDTGIEANDISKLKIRFSVKTNTSSHQGIMGGGWSEDNSTFQILYNYSSQQIRATYGSFVKNINHDESVHNIEISNSSIKIDDSEETHNSSISDNRTVVVFARRKNNKVAGGVSELSSSKVYSVQIYSGDTMLRDMIPCYRKSDNVVGMYDVVSNTFFTNQGSGSFKKGADTNSFVTTSTQVMTNDDHTLYAKWGHNPVVTFNANGGTVSPASKTITYNSNYGELPVPTKEGYTFLGWVRNNLPSQYQEVEYIESTGTQYMDTGIEANDISKLKIRFSVKTNTSSHQGIVGGGWSTDNSTFQILYSYSSQQIRATYGSFIKNINHDESVHTIEISNSSIKIDDSEETHNSSISDNRTVVVFARRKSDKTLDGVSELSSSKVYSVQIYSGDTMLRDMIPCYRKSDNVVGMYDVVSNTFFTNQGTGNFSKGTDINSLVTTSTQVITNDDHTLYAKWEKIPEYNVTMNVSGGTSNPASKSIVSGGTDTFEITPSSIYTLTGATVSCSQATASINESTGVVTISNVTEAQTCTVTLPTAVTPGQSYTITFAVNGGTALTKAKCTAAGGTYMSTLKTCKKTVVTGEAYGTLPEPAKSGDTFTGWYTASSGGDLITESSIVAITKNTTLYAHWLSSQGATVTISVNGGTSSPASATITSGGSSEFTITPSSGHTLTGATVSCPQATSNINESTGVVTLSNITQAQTCIVTLHDESATITTRTITYYSFTNTNSSWPTSINSDGTLYVQNIDFSNCPITYDILCIYATCNISTNPSNSTRAIKISNPTGSVGVTCCAPNAC